MKITYVAIGTLSMMLTLTGCLESSIDAGALGTGGGSNTGVDTSTGDAAATDIVAGKKAWVDGVEVTGSATDQGAINLDTTAIPGSGGFFSSIVLSLTASDICTGKSIFGSSGTAVCNSVFGDVTSSQAYRQDNGTVDLSNSGQVDARVQSKLSDEIAANAAFSTNSKLVPDPQYDTDGRYDDTGIGQKRHYLETVKGRPDTVCGLSGTTAQRVSDCSTRNTTKSVWEGSKYGQSGEGDWKLVTLYSTAGGAVAGDTCSGGFASGCSEVWRDERTKQIWSDTMLNENGVNEPTGSGYNWFKAAGYSSNADTTAKTGYQGQANTGTDCYDPGYSQTQPCQPAVPVSVCADAATIAGLNGVGTYQNPDGTNNTTDERPKKGGMTGATYQWRLPTIEDWNVANANGIRKVLPNMDYAFWSASSVSNIRVIAWVFSGDGGYVSYGSRFYPDFAVRCVGR